MTLLTVLIDHSSLWIQEAFSQIFRKATMSLLALYMREFILYILYTFTIAYAVYC